MIEALIAGAAATLIGVLSGQAMVLSAGRHRLAARVRQLEGAVPELISRSEVQNAFAQVAQIEAQRQAATVQQARAAAVFGGPSDADRSGLNANVNAQLDALNARLNRINQEFGLR